MGVKSLMARLQSRAADTPDTSEKNMGYQRKAPIHAGCTSDTPDTPCFVNTPAIVQIVQIVQIGEAVNDPAPEPPIDPNAWRELATAYHLHHFKCSACIAAGRGAVERLSKHLKDSMTTKPLFTPTADGAAYDIQPAGVLLILAGTVYGDPSETPPASRIRGKALMDAMLKAARAGASRKAIFWQRCWRAMKSRTG